MTEREYVRIDSLEIGMCVAQPLINEKRNLFIAEGTILDRKLIELLSKMELPGIYIRRLQKNDKELPKETRKQIEKATVEDKSKLQLSESVKQRVSEGIQYLYNNTDSQNFTDTTNNITNDLMKAITENDAVAVDVSALKVSDEYTFKHSVDVASIGMIIAKKYGMSDSKVYQIGICGLLHDLGKSKIPLSLLNKPGKLEPEEFEEMKRHSTYGYQILKKKNDLSHEIMMGVLQHHEKLNGRGYPMGCKDDDICEFAKILSVADIYDALVTERPYKKAFAPCEAVEMIMAMTNELDIEVIRSFLASVILYPVGTDVMLNTGEMARVVENVSYCVQRPTVVGLTTGRVYHLADDLSCASVLIV